MSWLLEFLKGKMRTPFSGVAISCVVFFGVPFVTALSFGSSADSMMFIFPMLSVLFFLGVDIVFRIGYRFKHGSAYEPFERVPFEKISVEPHPYLPFVYKRNAVGSARQIANYPLHKGRFFFGETCTNNLRFASGPGGGRDVSYQKPYGVLRVGCLGASTTGNYIELEGRSYSYPMELERILGLQMNCPVEVLNCGQGGYNSADIMVRFALQVIDTQPDVVIIYHAYNDIQAYLTPSFDSDYSHARRNLGESYWRFRLASKIPPLPLKFVDFLFSKWFLVSIRNSLLGEVVKGEIDLRLDPSAGLKTYRRNIQHIISLCKCNGIKVMLSTYCHFLYESIKDDPLHIVYGNIVKQENEIVRSLAEENHIGLVDNAVLVPKKEKYFVDSIHFTPEGMQLIAANIAEEVKKVFPELLKKS